jgi:hypothetical protein
VALLRFATSSQRGRASAPRSILARRAEMPVRFLAAAGSRDGQRAVLSCVAGIWTMTVDLAATTTTMLMLTAQQGEWRERGALGGQEGVTEWATCSSFLSRMYG